MPQKKVTLIISLWLALIGVACQKEETKQTMPPGSLPPLEMVTLDLKGTKVEIEIAYTMAELTQGLMYRTSMPENHGMLFVYPEPRFMSFWMKNTKIPLSIAFIRDDLIISNIEDMAPHNGPFDPIERYESNYQCLYALEMNAGWFVKNGIQEGDKFELPIDQIQAVIAMKNMKAK